MPQLIIDITDDDYELIKEARDIAILDDEITVEDWIIGDAILRAREEVLNDPHCRLDPGDVIVPGI